MWIDQGWANFLTCGSNRVLNFDRGAEPGADGCSVCVKQYKRHVKVIA